MPFKSCLLMLASIKAWWFFTPSVSRESVVVVSPNIYGQVMVLLLSQHCLTVGDPPFFLEPAISQVQRFKPLFIRRWTAVTETLLVSHTDVCLCAVLWTMSTGVSTSINILSLNSWWPVTSFPLRDCSFYKLITDLLMTGWLTFNTAIISSPLETVAIGFVTLYGLSLGGSFDGASREMAWVGLDQ